MLTPHLLWNMLTTRILLILVAGSLARGDLDLNLFTAEAAVKYGARCLDGSPAGFYFKRGVESNKWVFFLEGGGYCHTQEDCMSRAHSALGSSRFWPKTKSGVGFSATSRFANPDFHNWTQVYIPYCGGDLHSGTRRTAVWDLYFAGHLIIDGVMDVLVNDFFLPSATDVLLWGESAGAIGTFEHADYFASLIPNATVKASPAGGFYFPGNPKDYSEFIEELPAAPHNSSLYDLYQAHVDAGCAASNKDHQYMCGPANVAFLFPYIKTPLYIAENQFDSNQIFAQLGCPQDHSEQAEKYILYFGTEMRETIRSALESRQNDGLYFPACLQHTENLRNAYQTQKIDGVTYGESMADWYFSQIRKPHIVYVNVTTPQC